MRNLRALKISATFGLSGLLLLLSMPAKAQQLVLTPSGTMLEIAPSDGGILGDQPWVDQPDGMKLLGIDSNSQQVEVNNNPNPVFTPDNPGISVGSLIPLKAVARDSYDKDGRLIQTKEQAAAEIVREDEIRALYPNRLGVFDGSTNYQSADTSPVAASALLPAASVTLPSVTVQASQNPTADFATTRSAPRNTIPEQLNQGIIDSPLSNSRIFPGMR